MVAAGVGTAVAAEVAAGEAAVATGVAVTPVSANSGADGEVVAAGDTAVVAAGVATEAYGVGTAVAAEVLIGVAAGVSVGVAGRASGDVGTSLAWLAGPWDREGDEGLVVGLVVGVVVGLEMRVAGAGAGAEGQRLQVAAQYPPAGAPLLNMKLALHLP